jgi:hypothetical protein
MPPSVPSSNEHVGRKHVTDCVCAYKWCLGPKVGMRRMASDHPVLVRESAA